MLNASPPRLPQRSITSQNVIPQITLCYSAVCALPDCSSLLSLCFGGFCQRLSFQKQPNLEELHASKERNSRKQMAPLRAHFLPVLSCSCIQLIFHNHPTSLRACFCTASPSPNIPKKAPGLGVCLHSEHQHSPCRQGGRMGSTIPAEKEKKHRLVFSCRYYRSHGKNLGLGLSQKCIPERELERGPRCPHQRGTGQWYSHPPQDRDAGGCHQLPSCTAAWQGGDCRSESSIGSYTAPQNTSCRCSLPL